METHEDVHEDLAPAPGLEEHRDWGEEDGEDVQEHIAACLAAVEVCCAFGGCRQWLGGRAGC